MTILLILIITCSMVHTPFGTNFTQDSTDPNPNRNKEQKNRDSPTDDSAGLSYPAVIGIVVGIIASLSLLVGGIVFLIKCRENQMEQHKESLTLKEEVYARRKPPPLEKQNPQNKIAFVATDSANADNESKTPQETSESKTLRSSATFLDVESISLSSAIELEHSTTAKIK